MEKRSKAETYAVTSSAYVVAEKTGRGIAVKALLAAESEIDPGHASDVKGTTMTNSTPEQDPTSGLDPEAQTPTPTPSSGDAGEFKDTGSTAEKPAEADSPEDADPSEVPSNDELEEPSTEKEPSEEPKAPTRNDPEPDHEAVGIGVIDGPETDEGD
ncbi:hypothetical protein [Microbacterium sp.]